MWRFLIGAALLLILLLVGAEQVVESTARGLRRAFVERKLSQAFGLEVELKGEIGLRWLPRPHVEATVVSIANLPGRPSPYLAEIGRVDFDFNLWQLLRRTVEIERIWLAGVEVRVEGDESGIFAWEHELESLADEIEPADDPLSFRIREVVLEDVAFFYRRSAAEPVLTVQLQSVSLKKEIFTGPITLAMEGDVDGSPFDLRGRIGSLAQLLAPTEPFPVALSGRLFEAELELEGTLEAPSNLAGLDLALSASLPDLGVLPGDSGGDLRVLGPVTVSARLRERDEIIGVEDLVVSTRSDGPTHARLTGRVRDLSALRGVDLELQVESKRPVLLEALLERPLPRIEALRVSARVSDDDGTLGVAGEIHATGLNEAFTLALAGDYGDLARMQEIEIDVQLRVHDLMLLGDVLSLPHELPQIGPVRISGKLRNRDDSVGVDDLSLQMGRPDETWARVEGSVRDMLNVEGVELVAEFGARDLSQLSVYLERDLPDVGPLRGAATLSDQDGSLGLEALSLRAARAKVFEIELLGAIDDLREVGEIGVDARLEARDLSVLGALAGVELPPIGQVRFTGRVQGSDENLGLRGQVLLDRTELSGEWRASFAAGTRPWVHVRVSSPHVYLDDIGISPEGPSASERPVVQATEERRADAGLGFERLRSLDADVVLRAERITGAAGLEMVNARTSLQLEVGQLTVSAQGVIEGGGVDAELRVDARSPEPRLSLRAAGGPIDLSRVMAQFREEHEQAGLLDVFVDLRSHGSTRPRLLAGLEGQVEAVLRDGQITSRYGRRLVREFIKVSIPQLRRRKPAPVACGLVQLAIEAGVAEIETFHLEGEGVSVSGSGTVDLPANRLGLRLTPTIRDPGLLSIAVSVNVTGPLTDPDFRPVGRSVVTSAVRGLASNVTKFGRAAMRPLGRDKATPEQICAAALRARQTPAVASPSPGNARSR